MTADRPRRPLSADDLATVRAADIRKTADAMMADLSRAIAEGEIRIPDVLPPNLFRAGGFTFDRHGDFAFMHEPEPIYRRLRERSAALPTRFEMTMTLEPPRQCGWCGYGPGPYIYEDRCWRCGEPPTEPFGELLSPRATLTLRWNTLARRPAMYIVYDLEDPRPANYQTAEVETLPLARAALLSTFLRRP